MEQVQLLIDFEVSVTSVDLEAGPMNFINLRLAVSETGEAPPVLGPWLRMNAATANALIQALQGADQIRAGTAVQQPSDGPVH